jgi:hypothetical protein
MQKWTFFLNLAPLEQIFFFFVHYIDKFLHLLWLKSLPPSSVLLSQIGAIVESISEFRPLLSLTSFLLDPSFFLCAYPVSSR